VLEESARGFFWRQVIALEACAEMEYFMDSGSRYPGPNLGLPANLSNHLACLQIGNIIFSKRRIALR
jgi:hypothetical protein